MRVRLRGGSPQHLGHGVFRELMADLDGVPVLGYEHASPAARPEAASGSAVPVGCPIPARFARRALGALFWSNSYRGR